MVSGDDSKRARSAALRYLGYRDRTVREMRDYLERKEYSPAVVRQTLAYLQDSGFLDDARFADRFARSRVENRRFGRFRLKQELIKKGVEDAVAEQALDAVFAEVKERDLARASGEKKMQGWRGLEVRKIRQRLAQFLQRQGFSADTVYETVEDLAPW